MFSCGVFFQAVPVKEVDGRQSQAEELATSRRVALTASTDASQK